jgi:hypothetical protein
MRVVDLFENESVRGNNTQVLIEKDLKGCVSCKNPVYNKLSNSAKNQLPKPKHCKSHVQGLIEHARYLGDNKLAVELLAYMKCVWPA